MATVLATRKAASSSIATTVTIATTTTSMELHGAVSSPSPGVSSVVLASVTGALAVCSLVGNAFVFLTVSRSKTLQRINNALILSLAVADLLRSSTVVPLYAGLLLVDVPPTDQRWLCPLYTALLVCCELAVVLNVTLIAVERVFLITKPLVYQRTVTLGKVSAVIASVWILSLVFGAMQALRFLPESDDREEFAAFTSVVCFSVPSLGYAVFDVTLTLVVPVATLVVCYGKIFFVVHSQMRRIVPVVSDTYGNSEAVPAHGEPWRNANVTRSTSLSGNRGDSSAFHHGPSEPPPHRRHQSSVFTIDVAPSNDQDGSTTTAVSSSYFLAVRPLPGIDEDHVESSRGHSSGDGNRMRSEKPLPTTVGGDTNGNSDDGDHGDRPVRILVTQPSRESLNHNVVGGNDRKEVVTPLGGHDLLLPGVVPTASELEPILSPINLNWNGSASRRSHDPSTGPSGTTIPIRRGSSVTFDLKTADDLDLEDEVNPQRTKHRGSSTVNRSHPGSPSLPLPPPPPGIISSLAPGPNRVQRRPSQDGSTHRVSVVNPTLGSGAQGLARRNSVARINDNKAFKMTVVVVGAFLVCWFPAKICYLLRVTSGPLISDLTFDIVTCLTLAASALDPYIYNFYSAEFRRALRRVVTCSADKPDMPWM